MIFIMKRFFLAIVSLLLIFPSLTKADEGMWLPLLLKNEKYAEMRKMGLKLSVEEIYSVNQACLKDAVVGLMGEGTNLRSYGTASFISEDGLLITNYHVVLSYIERFSTEENDFIKYGYWAGSKDQESLCRGLQIKQLVRMEDVTERMLAGTEGLTGVEKQNKINENGKLIADEATKGTKYEVRMQALFGDSQYIMNVYVVYKDVRMVAAPPFALGKFGGNTDNYRWPRHTLDFSVLRVYANENNDPANYSTKNVPYKPKHYLPISSNGVKENDFVMVMGFPGSTRQYIPSFALEKIIYDETAEKVAITRDKMNILKNAIEEDPSSKFRYTNRLSSVGNNYLRWSGEVMGVNRMDLVARKQEEEKEFRAWVAKKANRVEKYGNILDRIEEHYKQVAVYNLANTYFLEAGINGSEIVPFIGKFEKLVAMYNRNNLNQVAANREASNLVKLTDQFFRNWNYEVDRRMFRNLTYRYYQKMPPQFQPEELVKTIHKYDGDIELLSNEVFKNSIFTNKDKLIAFLESESRDVEEYIKNDELYQIAIGYYRINVDKIARQRTDLQRELIDLQSIYLAGLLEMSGKKALYPDANNSQRVSYGCVVGTNAEDGLSYYPFTTFEGAYAKYMNNNEDEEFYLPKKLRDVYSAGNIKQYLTRDDKFITNFLTNAHTTSGSSGSPVINGKGELVGLNFDRIWQGVASDYRYSSETSRSISVDIRYVMFVLEKYAPNNYVFNELSIKR
jgi:hypothetical protein